MKRLAVNIHDVVKNPPLWFANAYWPRHIAERKFLFAGMSGSGKTLSIRLLLQTALMGFKCGVKRRALVYDAKGDWPGIIAGITEGWTDPPRVRMLNPFESKGYGYDFQADFARSHNPFKKAVNLAKTLIPKAGLGVDKNASFFTKTAQLILAWVTLRLHERATRWTLRDIIVAATDSRIIKLLLQDDDRGWAILRELERTRDTYSNVLQTVSSFLWELEPAALAWEHHIGKGRKFTFKGWLKSEDILIMSGTDEDPEALEPVNALLLEFLRQELRQLPEHPWYEPDVPETWLFLDEFQQLFPLPHLVDFFTITRSKGATQVVGIQDIDQLVHKYGEQVAHTILGQCGYVGILKLNSPSATAYFEKRIGSYEELKTLHQSNRGHTDSYDSSWSLPARSSASDTQGSSTGEQFLTRPGVLAQQFSQLDDVDSNLVIDAFYVANGPYERRRYSAAFGGCPLIYPPRKFVNHRPLKPAGLTRPRAFSVEDFQRLGIAESSIPADYFRRSREAPPRFDALQKLVSGWELPPDSVNRVVDAEMEEQTSLDT